MTAEAVGVDDTRCQFIKATGYRCRQTLTPTDTDGLCQYHAAMSGSVIERKRRLLDKKPTDVTKVSPMQAMLEEIDRTQVMIAWYESIIQSLEPDDLLQVVTNESRVGGPGGDYQLARAEQRPHPAVTLLNDERRHLANITRLAMQSGIEEKQLELNQQLANGLILAMQNFARLAALDPLAPQIKTWMTQAMRTARTGEVIDIEAVQPELPPGNNG